MALQEEFEEQGLWLFRYRSYLPIVILIIALGIYYFKPESNHSSKSVEIVGFAVSIIGLVVRAYTVGFTPKNTSGRNTSEGQVADTLNTDGIYSIVRHPLYVGNFLMWLGPIVFIGNWWFGVAFTLAYWIYYERIMYAEEQFLRRKFGEKYLHWSKNTPAFIPKINGFKSNTQSFSWRKVFLKEKNGLLATFIVFMLFNIVGEIGDSVVEYNMFFIVGSVLSILAYVVLKSLKRFTNYFQVLDK